MLARGFRLTKQRAFCCGLFPLNLSRFTFHGSMASGRVSGLREYSV